MGWGSDILLADQSDDDIHTTCILTLHRMGLSCLSIRDPKVWSGPIWHRTIARLVCRLRLPSCCFDL